MASTRQKRKLEVEEESNKRARHLASLSLPVDVLLHISTFLPRNANVAALLCTSKAIQMRRDRIVWPSTVHVRGPTPGFGRIRKLKVEGIRRWTFPVHAQTGHLLPVRNLFIGAGSSNRPISEWPPGLRTLKVRTKNFNRPLPEGLRDVSIKSDRFNHPFPAGIHTVALQSRRYNHVFPEGIRCVLLEFCASYDQEFPPGMKKIDLLECDEYNKPFPDGTRHVLVMYCATFNQPGPTGAKSFRVDECPVFNKPAGAGTRRFHVSACASFAQPYPAGARELKVKGCKQFKRWK